MLRGRGLIQWEAARQLRTAMPPRVRSSPTSIPRSASAWPSSGGWPSCTCSRRPGSTRPSAVSSIEIAAGQPHRLHLPHPRRLPPALRDLAGSLGSVAADDHERRPPSRSRRTTSTTTRAWPCSVSCRARSRRPCWAWPSGRWSAVWPAVRSASHDLPLAPPPSGEIQILPATVEAFAKDWSLPRTSRAAVGLPTRSPHATLGVPHVR